MQRLMQRLMRAIVLRPERSWWRDAVSDVIWGSRCLGCERPGPGLCSTCLARAHVPRWSSTSAHPRVLRAGEHAGAWRAAVVRHKEDGVRELRPVLARVLAASVTRVVADVLRDDPDAARVTRIVLVPVPSRAAVRRSRGDDPWRGVCRDAAAHLRRRGLAVRTVALLRVRRGVQDQSGLGRVERYANVRGMFVVRPRKVRSLSSSATTAIVLCDDVLTTGATLGAAAQALSRASLPPLGCVVLSEAVARSASRGRNVATK